MTIRRGRFPQRRLPRGAGALGDTVSSWVPDIAVMRDADGESSWIERLTLGAGRAVSADLRRRTAAWRSFSRAVQDLRAMEREDPTDPRAG